MVFFRKVIDNHRYYRVQLQSSNTWMAFTVSILSLLWCMTFCSILLVIASIFSDESSYTRESIIIHNALQVHLSIAIQQLFLIVLLYIDRFHFNISVYNGRYHIFTIGGYFCESLVRDDKQYYHWQKKLFKNFIIIDYVTSMNYAEEKGWIKENNWNVTNPIRDDINDRLTVITNWNDSIDRITVTDSVRRIE